MSQHEIEDGRRVEQFLADPAVLAALDRLEADYVAAWKSSTRAEERESLHAKARALDDFRNALQVVVDNGERATVERDRRDAANQRSR